MFQPRFSLISVSAMLLATTAVALLVTGTQSDGFGGHQGLPFAWYSWTDVIIDGRQVGGYRWGGLVADIVVWSVGVLVLGLLVERAVQRLLARKNAA
jgi:hypothetical protein